MIYFLLPLSVVAVIAVIVIYYHNRRLYAQISRRNEELSALNSVIATVSQSLDLTERLNNALDKVLEVMNMESGGIYLLRKHHRLLKLFAHRGLSKEIVQEVKELQLGEGFAGRVVLSGEPMVLQDISVDARLTKMIMKKEGFRAYAGFPLKSKDKVLGVMSIISRNLCQFTTQDMELLSAIGNQLGVAVENGQLYHKEKNRSKQLATSVLEAHHRIKNNLQTVSDLLTLQLFEESEDVIPKDTLKASIERINTIAMVHEFLSKDAHLKTINVKDVLNRLVPMVASANVNPSQDINVSINAIEISLPSKDVTSLALIANELVSNAMKHAFKKRNEGSVVVELKALSNNICLQVKDDGIGLPEGFNINVNGHVGLEVSRTLAERDLDGTLNLVSDSGTTAEVLFPKI
ncbi:GAF domain-containing protein [bacterium]|nr:GAF domain-containing protein [bacterium]